MTICVPGQRDTTAACCPLVRKGMPPRVLLQITDGGEVITILLEADHAASLGKALGEASVAINPALTVWQHQQEELEEDLGGR